MRNNLPKGTIVPDHIAIILDGNGRWARAKGLPATRGHEKSAQQLAGLMRACRVFGVHTLTIWGFSTENWKRPPAEVAKLLSLIKLAIKRYEKEAMKEGIRFIHLGRKDRLPGELASLIKKVEEKTKENSNNVLNVAIDYGGRDEILRAVKGIIKDKVDPSKLDERLFESYLDTKDQPYPNPDLFIRPSGEQRSSGLLPWQTVYSEFYWEEDHLPELGSEHIKRAILDYSRRRRRFGGKGAERHLKFKPEITANLELAWWRLRKVPQNKRFREFVAQYIKEQYGISKDLSKKAAKYMVEGIVSSDKKKLKQAKKAMKQFYALVKDQIKLAFEPEVLASLRVQLWQDVGQDITEEVEELARNLTAEEFRLSKLQASKAAHLRLLAKKQMSLAENTKSEKHWRLAHDYLHKYYQALKDKVA